MGVPLALVVTGANRQDASQLEARLDYFQIERQIYLKLLNICVLTRAIAESRL
jgi:hypothetical protein